MFEDGFFSANSHVNLQNGHSSVLFMTIQSLKITKEQITDV